LRQRFGVQRAFKNPGPVEDNFAPVLEVDLVLTDGWIVTLNTAARPIRLPAQPLGLALQYKSLAVFT